MFAEVKQFQWTDVEDDTDAPELPTLLEMYVVSPGQAGVTRYEVAVTTIEELSQRMRNQPYVAGHGQVVVAEFDRRGIESFLRSSIAQISADSWEGLDAAISRFGRSEFAMTDTYWSPNPWEAPAT